MIVRPSSVTSYAYVIPEDKDKQQIEQLGRVSVRIEPAWDSLKGVKIEISEKDQIPKELRVKLQKEKYFLIE